MSMDRLDQLEAQSIYIFREAFARMKNLALLWSLGKDSNVMIWLARKAFFGRVPFPVMHVDTGKKFPEMYASATVTRSSGIWNCWSNIARRSTRSTPLASSRALGRAKNRRPEARARQAWV